jgi:hypothetical protein
MQVMKVGKEPEGRSKKRKEVGNDNSFGFRVCKATGGL